MAASAAPRTGSEFAERFRIMVAVKKQLIDVRSAIHDGIPQQELTHVHGICHSDPIRQDRSKAQSHQSDAASARHCHDFVQRDADIVFPHCDARVGEITRRVSRTKIIES
jgi:hypothetical protein